MMIEDKIKHLLVFIAFVPLVWTTSGLSLKQVFIFGMVLAVFTELTDLLRPSRQFDIMDLAADFGGLIIGAASSWRIKHV